MSDFVIYRILGNDLPPRHSPDQTLKNLRWILEHEPRFDRSRRCFLLNRIYKCDVLDEIIEVLNVAEELWYEIPFEKRAYKKLPTMRERLTYLTNVNNARNMAIDDGLKRYEYVLPLDGACFFRSDGWEQFVRQCDANPNAPFMILPMWRVSRYEHSIDLKVPPQLREVYTYHNGSEKYQKIGATEPQVVFGRKSDLRFNPALTYGDRDKAELLWRLGVPGIWDDWHRPTDPPMIMSRFEGRIPGGGFVCRLPSGPVDMSNSERTETRVRACFELVERVNMTHFEGV